MIAMKTIIAAEYQKERIYHQLAENTGCVTDVQLLSAANLLRTDQQEDKETALLRLAHILSKRADDFPIYAGMFQFPAFINEVLSFARICALWSIVPTDLPTDTDAETELQSIVASALSLPLEEKTQSLQYAALLQKASSLNPLSIQQSSEPDSFRSRFLKDLIRLRPDAAEEKQIRHPSEQILYYALNSRQEIEACAQDIIAHNVPCTVVLCDYATQLPVLQQVFERYGIPFSPVQRPVSVSVPFQFACLAEFALQKDAETLLKVFRNDGFSRSCPDTLIPFLQEKMKAPDAPDHLFERIHEEQFAHTPQAIRRREEYARKFFDLTAEDRTLLLSSQTPREALMHAYKVLQHNSSLKSSSELQTAVRIRTLLNHTLNMIETDIDAEFIIQTVLEMKSSSPGPLNLFCTVTDPSHPVPVSDTLYLLGCSAGNFPAVPVRKGLFDEDYVGRIRRYPSLTQRHDDYLALISWVHESSRTVIYSYATNDYQGRSIQPSFDIVSRFQKDGRTKESPWPIRTLRPKPQNEHTLQADTAYRLFCENGMIHSSISSIERWFQCPYSYFLQSGLKARPSDEPILDARTTGTVQHAVLCELVKRYGKLYAGASEKDIASILDPYYEQLQIMNPRDGTRIRLSRDRMLESILLSLSFLKQMEESTIFKPVNCEKRFDFEIIDGIQLHGIIDRIDLLNHTFRIIDYKSSDQKLSESMIKTGTQLQLLSYAMAEAKETGMAPAGTYYFSMKQSPAEDPAGKAQIKGFSENDGIREPAHMKELMESRRTLKGWAWSPIEDDPDSYIRFFSPNKMLDFKEVSEAVEALYQQFRDGILSGQIQVDPTQNACGFCDYAAVCRNHKPAKKAEHRVMADTKFKYQKAAVKKEDSNR